VLNVALSLALGLGAAWLGYVITSWPAGAASPTDPLRTSSRLPDMPVAMRW